MQYQAKLLASAGLDIDGCETYGIANQLADPVEALHSIVRVCGRNKEKSSF